MIPETVTQRIPVGIKVPSLARQGAPSKRPNTNSMLEATGACGLGLQSREEAGMGGGRDASLLLGCILPLVLS